MNESVTRSAAASECEVTRLLNRLQDSPQVLDRIMGLVYEDIRRIARNQNRGFRGQQARTTELVHEVFLKLFADNPPALECRLHLMKVSALAVRQLIVDQARSRLSQKRGAGAHHLALDDCPVAVDRSDAERVLSVEQALERLAEHDRELADLIIGSYYGGYTARELAEQQGCCVRTVQRQLKRARGWLRLELGVSE